MILKKLLVKRFRRFADFSIDLAPGLNVVYGPNEGGKSTLHDAILAVLFGKPTSRSSEVLRTQTWLADGLPEVTLEFESEGTVFTLTKNFEEKSLAVTNHSTGDISREWSSTESLVASVTGLSSATLFKATAFVGQGDLATVASERNQSRGIGDELQRVVTGGGEDVVASAVIKKLDDRVARLQRGMQGLAREPGEIRAATDKIRELAGGISSGRDALATVEGAHEALKAEEEKLATLRHDLEDRRTLLAGYERRRRLEQELSELRQKENELDKRIAEARDLQQQIAAAGAKMESYGPVAELDAVLIGRIASLQEAISLWEQQGTEEQKVLEEIQAERADAIKSANQPGLLAGALVLIGTGIVGAVFYPRYYIYLLATSFIGILLAVLYVGLRLSAGNDRDHDSRTAHRRLRHSRSRMNRAQNELQGQLDHFSRPTYEELVQDYGAYTGLAGSRSELRAKLEGLLSGKTTEELEDLRREVSRSRRDKEESLSSLKEGLVGADLDPVALQRITREVETLASSIRASEESVAKQRATIDSASVSILDIHRLEEEQSFWRSQLEAAQRRLVVYRLARRVVEEAKNSVLTSAKVALEAGMGDYLATITGGRYRRVSVDEATLSFSVRSPEKGDGSLIDPKECLSRGAQDQLYLAARLSLLRLISGGRKPPLLFDDPFVTFDQPRLESTMRLCRELAQQHQIILFTCDEAYRRWADNFVTLPTL